METRHLPPRSEHSSLGTGSWIGVDRAIAARLRVQLEGDAPEAEAGLFDALLARLAAAEAAARRA